MDFGIGGGRNINSLVNIFIDILNTDNFNLLFNKIANQTTNIAIGLSLLFFIVILGYNYIKKSFENITTSSESNDGSILNMEDAVRTIVIVILISFYPLFIMPTLSGFVNIVNKMTRPSANQKDLYQKAFENYYETQNELIKNAKTNEINEINKALNNNNTLSSDERKILEERLEELQKEPSIFDKAYNIVNYMFNAIYSSLTAAINEGILALTSIIKLILALCAMLIFKILLVLGPLAFAFSIIPAWKSQIEIWFSTVISTGLVLTTLNILDHVFYAIIGMAFSNNGANINGYDFITILILSIVMIIMYLMSFWLTSKFVGKADGGRAITKLITLSTMALSMGAGVVAAKGKGGNIMKDLAKVYEKSQKNTKFAEQLAPGEE